MPTLARRPFLQLAAAGAATLPVACAPAASSPAVLAGAAPAASEPVVEAPVRVEGWEQEWAQLVAAAQQEGRLSLLTVVGRGYQTLIDRFQEAFPGLAVDHVAESSSGVWLSALRRARQGGGQTFDLALVQPDAALGAAGSEGLWAPIKPLLFRPDVVDDGTWRGGLQARFLDAAGDLCFDWEYQIYHAYAVNVDLVREDEIRSVTDLLDPRWRGRIISSDPRLGAGLLSAAAVSSHWGADVLRRLMVDQRPLISPVSGGGRALGEAFLQGRFPIAQGLRPKPLNELRAQGLAQTVRYLDLPDADYVPSIAMLHPQGAPHPAAARLFANWFLTQEGQSILTGSLVTNSARTDVPPFEPDGIGAAGNTYFEPDRQSNYRHIRDTQTVVERLVGSRP